MLVAATVEKLFQTEKKFLDSYVVAERESNKAENQDEKYVPHFWLSCELTSTQSWGDDVWPVEGGSHPVH